MGNHSFHNICHGKDPGLKQYFLSLQTIRITRTVESLMMLEHYFSDDLRESEFMYDLRTRAGMNLEKFEFRFSQL